MRKQWELFYRCLFLICYCLLWRVSCVLVMKLSKWHHELTVDSKGFPWGKFLLYTMRFVRSYLGAQNLYFDVLYKVTACKVDQEKYIWVIFAIQMCLRGPTCYWFKTFIDYTHIPMKETPINIFLLGLSQDSRV